LALPTLSKSWVFTKVNQAIKEQFDYRDGARKQLYAIKDAIKSWTGWTVKGSSDAVNAAMDGVDRWTDYSKIIWDANFSWIVLEKPNAGGPGKDFEILIACATSPTTDNLYVHLSWAGFAGGNISTRPTAVDTYQLLNNVVWRNTAATTGFDCVIHAISSSDGDVGRIFMLKNNVVILYAAFETANNPVTGWTHPYYAAWAALDTTFAIFTDTARLICYDANAPAGWFANYLTCESHVNNTTPERVPYYNQFSGESPLYPVGAASTAANKRGRHGQLYDLWWGSPTRRVGDTYPDNGNGQFVDVGGNLVIPWNGSLYVPL